MWTYWICATTTGTKLAKVEPTGGSFSRRMNGVGSGSHEFVSSSLGLGDTVAARRASRLDLTRTWARTLVQCWDDVPKYAGLIDGKSRKGNSVTISTVEMREVFKYRTTFGLNGYSGFEDGKFEHKDQTLASIAGQLLWVLMVGRTSNWQLPLILPPRGMAGTQDRSYHDFNLPVVETELTAIQDAEGGPDIDFEPSWAEDGTLQWTSRVGNLSGNTLEWNLAAGAPALTDFGFVEDGNAQGNIFYAVGNGSDRDLKVATSTSLLAGDDVALERILQYSQERNRTVLQGNANEARNTFQKATRQYSLSMQADGTPGLSKVRLGQTVRTYTQDDDWLADGWQTHRVVGFSGDLTNTIKLQLQTL
ncbi:hypothetical protein [Curtobacterium sp. MCBD17_030]|uniref:hypothetical protein n=1 Tax=Curtobacterium sp. MCBD17_030 TaxID=2175649 RepID=UPI000D8C0B13|nr:hypothetical protein [Curtobacterium sp. MCBD17_030]PYY32349.1 hypothetical protein DEI89_13015 [Curtobacterium sp. MCBD17_030]